MNLNARNRNKGKTYKDGSKKPPNWEYYFTPPGMKTISKAGYKTKKEAMAAGQIAFDDFVKYGITFESDITLEEYLKQWLEEYGRTNLKPTTIDLYENVINSQIVPALGTVKAKDVTTPMLQRLIDDKFHDGCTRGFVRLIKAVLGSAFKYAVNNARIIRFDPVAAVTLPNARVVPQKQPKDRSRRPVTGEEWQKMMERYPEGNKWHLALVLMYRCGFRKGEVCGLMWDDIDFENRTITVCRQMQADNYDAWYLTAPKYDSVRTITIDKTTCDLLKRSYSRQMHFRDTLGDSYYKIVVDGVRSVRAPYDNAVHSEDGEEIDLVLRQDDGRPLIPTAFVALVADITGKRASDAICDRFDIHSLRHTHATMLLDAGLPETAIQERLGHADLSTTKNIYLHTSETMSRRVTAKLEEMYNPQTNRRQESAG